MKLRSKHDWLLVILLAAVIVGLLGVFVKAKAEGYERRDDRWATQRFCGHYDWLGYCTRYRYERRRVHVPAHRYNDITTYRDPIRYYAAPRHDDERDDHEAEDAVLDEPGDRVAGDGCGLADQPPHLSSIVTA